MLRRLLVRLDKAGEALLCRAFLGGEGNRLENGAPTGMTFAGRVKRAERGEGGDGLERTGATGRSKRRGGVRGDRGDEGAGVMRGPSKAET